MTSVAHPGSPTAAAVAVSPAVTVTSTFMATVRKNPLVSLPLVFGAVSASIATTFDGDTVPELCVVRRCTGGYCPGCGGTRAVLALVKGDVAGSWAAHPWVPLLVFQLIVALAMVATGHLARLRRWVLPILVTNLVLVLTIWIVRLSTGAIPVPFA